ncbi:hypothetical protein PMG11_00407 [Penicillium brasilianum]|uniref:Cryptic loci regulator 2 N-terminal domain-containing protein n=1 Tax=Penicillium brasilianum TaxID=104259 RepID=A0A0F7TBW6_PENBI|nr:hypothetical protein PMG11_00407 [Penicillium brasilianum]
MLSDGEVSDDPNMVVIPVEDEKSDGKKSTWPVNGPDARFIYRIRDDEGWRIGLAQMWVEKQMGALEDGITYILEKLPEGYVLMDRPRGTDQKRDSFLFGHPTGRYFQSRVTFFVHFYWLMTDRAEPCECKLCSRQKQSGSKPLGEFRPRKRRTKAEMEADRARLAGAGQAGVSARPVFRKLPGDDEGPDYWKVHVMDLKEKGTLDEEVDHSLNLDWVLTHDFLTDYFVRLTLQPAFVPRRGEIVLWTHNLDGRLEFNPQTEAIEMRAEDGKWLGMPDWRAGVVTQVSEEESNYLDIIQETKKKQPVSYSGFRVETLPNPLDDDKSYSLHYKYVPLNCIKPFGAFERFLYPTPREKLHPSIENAMTTMASYSLLHKFRFSGTWPNARIDCKGIFIGPELLAVSDTARLKPFGMKAEDIEENPGQVKTDLGPTVTDVMVIEKIWLQLENCNADPNDEQLAQKMVPYIAGKVYTRDQHRLNRVMPFDADPLEKLTPKEVDDSFPQVGMRVYGRWYRVAGGKTCVVSPGMIIGRCYEPEATHLHYGTFDLDYDLHGILSGRRYSVRVDARIPPGLEFFWGDNRVETLGLATMNGVEVGPAAEQRDDPVRWQAILRILQGSTSDVDVRLADLGASKGVGRPRAKKTFSEVSKLSKLVSTGLGAGTENEDNGEGPADTGDSTPTPPSEMDLSESELTAPIPFREPSEGPEYVP